MSPFHSGATASATPIKRRGLLSYSAAAIAMTAMLSASPAAMAADPSGPTAPIEQLDTALLAAMKAGQNTPFAQRYAMLAPAVEQAYDLNTVLAAAVGPAWFSMTAAQKAALEPAFQRYTISDYTANFDSYDGQSFRVLPQTRALPDGDVVVRTQIERPNKSPVTIDYVMRHRPAGWKVVDVLSDGAISSVAVQRSDFTALLASGGAPALEAGLQRKVQTLSNGALA
jgi:phospholipid transport system substrate-binding protein